MYDESLTYDKNGNILSLKRNGDFDYDYSSTSAFQIDDLKYTYDLQKKNQLMKVTDQVPFTVGFKDGTNTGDDYGYDVNGNMTRDKNKGIEIIKYNHLNLPVEIIFGTGNKIEYLYNAVGQKVRKTVTKDAVGTVTDYLDGFQYTDAKLSFFPHAEGYVKVTLCEECQQQYQVRFNYVYNYSDHLGNIRLSYGIDPKDEILKIMEENHYYPFGLKHTNYNGSKLILVKDEEEIMHSKLKQLPGGEQVDYKYKYNGKEWQDELGLNMYDMDMRQYDAAIARWVVQDPVVHFDYSPYSAFDNNPVVFADPSGADSETDMFGRAKYDKWGTYIPPYERANVDQDSNIDKLAAKSLKETAKLYIDGVDLSNLSESGKQKIFKTDAIGTIGILLWEFATGTGKGVRKFEVGTHPFADKLMDGRILEEIVNEFNEKAKKNGYNFSNAGNSKEYNIALEFSPNKNPTSWMESIKKHVNSNAVQFFVGGAIAKVRIQDNNLMIQIYNETSRSSLMLHIGENYDRKDGNKPLSTIKQYINASYQLIKN